MFLQIVDRNQAVLPRF